MKVAGLDPSLASTGIARTDGTTGRIETTPRIETFARLARIESSTMSELGLVGPLVIAPELVVIEGIGGGGPGRQAAIATVGLGTVLRLMLWREDVAMLDIAPTTLKAYATGSGGKKVGKPAMRAAYAERLLPVTGRPSLDLSHDEIDALWLRDVGLWLTETPGHAGPDRHTGTKILDGIRARWSSVSAARRTARS